MIKAKAKDDDGESEWKEYVLIIFKERASSSLNLVYPFTDYNGFLLFEPTIQDSTSKLESVRYYKNNGLDYRLYFRR